MNTPLKYNNEIYGNLKYYELDDNGNIKFMKFILYHKSWFDPIKYDDFIDNLKKSVAFTLDKNPDVKAMDNNKLYQFDIVEDGETYLIIRIM